MELNINDMLYTIVCLNENFVCLGRRSYWKDWWSKRAQDGEETDVHGHTHQKHWWGVRGDCENFWQCQPVVTKCVITPSKVCLQTESSFLDVTLWSIWLHLVPQEFRKTLLFFVPFKNESLWIFQRNQCTLVSKMSTPESFLLQN